MKLTTTRITPTYTLLPGADPILTAPTEDLRAYHLRLMALRLNLVAGFADLLSLDTIDFTPFDYQIKAARTALRRFRGRKRKLGFVGWPEQVPPFFAVPQTQFG